MPQPFIVRAVLNAVRALPDFRARKIVDLSCGDGEVLEALHGDGCDVEGTHFIAGDYILNNPRPVLKAVTIHPNVALDALPFANGAYDIVLMTEVIEHLPDHFRALGEVARVLKPGGWLVLTTPNISRLHSRFGFAFTGAHKLIRKRLGWDAGLDHLHEFHINPLDFPTCHAYLRMLGLSVESLGYTTVKWRHLWLMILYPFIWIASLREYCAPRGSVEFRKGERALFKWMTGFPMLFSEQHLIVARKSPVAAGSA